MMPAVVARTFQILHANDRNQFRDFILNLRDNMTQDALDKLVKAFGQDVVVEAQSLAQSMTKPVS